MDLWAAVVIAGLIGFGIGAAVVWWIGRQQVGGTSVSALKKEHEQFREQVTTHFVETADLINRLTDSYKDVFDHLSKGAETLVDDKSLRDRMPQVSDQEVRLKRIGSRSATDARTGSASASKPSDGPAEAGTKASGGAKPAGSRSSSSAKPSGPPAGDGSSEGDKAARSASDKPANTSSAGSPAKGGATQDGGSAPKKGSLKS